MAHVKVGDKDYTSFERVMTDNGLNFDADSKAKEAAHKTDIGGAIKAVGYPEHTLRQ